MVKFNNMQHHLHVRWKISKWCHHHAILSKRFAFHEMRHRTEFNLNRVHSWMWVCVFVCLHRASCIIKVYTLIIDIIIIMQTIISVLRLRMYVCVFMWVSVAIRKMAVNTNGWWNKKVVQFRLFPNEREWMSKREWVIWRSVERQFFALNNNQPHRDTQEYYSAMTPLFSRMIAQQPNSPPVKMFISVRAQMTKHFLTHTHTNIFNELRVSHLFIFFYRTFPSITSFYTGTIQIILKKKSNETIEGEKATKTSW